MEDYSITVEEHPSEDDLRELIANLVCYNDSQAGPEGRRQQLALFLRDKGGKIVGGLDGYTHWGWLFVSTLWIAEELRGRGCGRKLMQRAEAEAVARGCHHAHLDTFSFQSLKFYESLGYKVFGTLTDYPAGHVRYFMQKRDLVRALPKVT